EGVVVLQVAGTAYFRVEAYDPRTQQRRTEYLSLEPGAERLLALVFPPCGRVEGRILNHLGDPVGGIPIRLYGADSFGEATSAADGSFGFDGVRAGEGTIVLEVSQVLRAGFSGTQRLRAREERAQPAAHGERVAVDVVLDVAAELRGRLLPPGPEGYLVLRCSHPVYGTSFGAYVQTDGFYRFTGVPSGPYRLLFAQAERGLLAVAEGEITTDDQPVVVDLPLRPGATLPLSRSSYDGRTWTLSTDLSLDGSLGLEAPVQVEIADLDGEEIVAGPRRVLVGSWMVRVLDRLEEAGALVLSELDYGELIEEDPAWVLCRVGDRWEVILWSVGVAQPQQRREGSRLLSPAGRRL
ncbi:MAG TPA: carboxypeptidase-like regulatory domain-containing protein, partial [Myxococcota bacterium]|nr:carboxypeptidase-like regulatory domain-containing protein [Myxococcota bacterium]